MRRQDNLCSSRASWRGYIFLNLLNQAHNERHYTAKASHRDVRL